MENCIKNAKKIILTQVLENRIHIMGSRFSEYQKTYFWTNENIRDYLDLVNFDGKDSALSVLSSGDHAFNLVTNGVLNIDTFDSNKLTEYYALGLKRAMILKYNYEEFCQIIERIKAPDLSTVEASEIIISLFPYMEEKHKKYWQEILDYNYRIQCENSTNLNIFLLFAIEKSDYMNPLEKGFNNYLLNKDNYELLRKRLYFANISFKCVDAKDLSTEFSKRYDFILLSNIMDYFYKCYGYGWNYSKLHDYKNELLSLASDDAVIFLHCVMAYLKDGEPFRKEIINFSSVSKLDLTSLEFVLLPERNGISNAVILNRVK